MRCRPAAGGERYTLLVIRSDEARVVRHILWLHDVRERRAGARFAHG
jgi:hypothetical protein